MISGVFDPKEEHSITFFDRTWLPDDPRMPIAPVDGKDVVDFDEPLMEQQSFFGENNWLRIDIKYFAV